MSDGAGYGVVSDGYPDVRRDTSAARVASDGLRVFVANGGTLHAYGLRDGRERWRSHAAGLSTPAFGSGLVVAVDAGGRLRAFDPATGAARWTAMLPLMRARAAVVAASDGFFVYGASRDGSFAASVGAGGHLWWERDVRGASFFALGAIAGSIAYVQDSESGATTVTQVRVFRLGANGGPLGATTGDGPIAIDAGGAWLAYAWNSGSTTFGVVRLDAVSGFRPSAQWLYTPNSDPRAQLPGFGQTAIDGGYVFGQTHENAGTNLPRAPIYRYPLAPADGRQPLIVSAGARWIGGPHAGTIVAERGDGLWLLRAGTQTVRALHALTYDDTTTHADVVAFDGAIVYVGFSDGRLVAIETGTGRVRASAAGVCPDDWIAIAVGGPVVFGECSTSIAAFARIAAS